MQVIDPHFSSRKFEIWMSHVQNHSIESYTYKHRTHKGFRTPETPRTRLCRIQPGRRSAIPPRRGPRPPRPPLGEGWTSCAAALGRGCRCRLREGASLAPCRAATMRALPMHTRIETDIFFEIWVEVILEPRHRSLCTQSYKSMHIDLKIEIWIQLA